jgi:hypothetical protein
MRHFLLLLCPLLLFTNAVSADEFSEYLTNEWGVELSINIEEVTSSHITQDDIQTTESSACPELLCVCMDVRDEEKSSFDSYRKRALIKSQTWQIPNIRNAIPRAENSYFTGIAYASYTAVGAPEMALLSDMASCTLYVASRGQYDRFTNGGVYMYANLCQGDELNYTVDPIASYIRNASETRLTTNISTNITTNKHRYKLRIG